MIPVQVLRSVTCCLPFPSRARDIIAMDLLAENEVLTSYPE